MRHDGQQDAGHSHCVLHTIELIINFQKSSSSKEWCNLLRQVLKKSLKSTNSTTRPLNNLFSMIELE
jgi:hypothetical protein